MDADLLSHGWVLDAGCRGWCFASAMLGLGEHVLAVDPAPLEYDGGQYVFENVALTHKADSYRLRTKTSPMGWRIDPAGDMPCYGVTVEDLMERHAIQQFDCVKLDIEGSEYGVLANWPGPVARQLSIEWHAGDMRKAIGRISQWYEVVYQNGDSDVLWVLK